MYLEVKIYFRLLQAFVLQRAPQDDTTDLLKLVWD